MDAQKGKVFTKLGREIAIAVRQGGADPESNFKLKEIIAKAKTSNMPNENIMRCIKKAAGEADADKYEEISYEGYGPGGIAVIIEAMTDNRNRTAGDIRHIFDKFGGNLGQTGCVSFMFEKKGVIVIEKTGKTNEDELMMEALEAGAEDFNSGNEYFEIVTQPADFSSVRETLEKKGYDFMQAEIQMVPGTTVSLADIRQIELMEKLVENLEDLEDVKNVYHNWEQS